MSKPATQRRTRRAAGLAIGLVLVVIATAMVIIEPFPHGATLLALTNKHGIHAGDVPAIALYLVGALLALWSSRTRRAAGLAVGFMLVVVATGMVIIEPFPHGAVLLALTHEHGIHAGDVPAIALYLVAALLALWS